jgi:RNA polymerase sigma-70 factor (ECF subfamily)
MTISESNPDNPNDNDKNSEATARFETQRKTLTALAYRMLGERSAAADVVQEAWIRWHNADPETIRTPAAWLRQTTTRLAIDALRSAKRQRETYIGPWLAEPILDTANQPDDQFALARKCELALLWAMERLAPEERAAFILREALMPTMKTSPKH